MTAGTWSDVRAVMVRTGDTTPAGMVDTIDLHGALRLVVLTMADGARFTRRYDELVTVSRTV